MPLVKSKALLDAMLAGRAYAPSKEEATQLLADVFAERYHTDDWKHFQARTPLLRGEDHASWAGWILAENPTSGAYQGTSVVWFPGDSGSVAVLCVGTGGFGPDAHILARPGHRRRLHALARLHPDRLWVKPDFLDLEARVPEATSRAWPAIEAALRIYGNVIYAACPVRNASSWEAVEDLLDLFFQEHRVRLKGEVKERFASRHSAILSSLFPRLAEDDVARILEERRFLILQGPPGTGKTRLAEHVAHRYGDPTTVQFHPARTYEDFVIGLAPHASGSQLAFEVRAGDLLRANRRAREQGRHVLFIDEINRGDLSRVLGEAIYLFEVGEPDRTVELPHPFDGERRFGLAPGLMVLGTRNTADRSIARIDLAIRRRFAFLDVWPDLDAVEAQGDAMASEAFRDTLEVFTEFADDAGIDLTPGHAYFLDPRPDLAATDRPRRLAERLRYELVPLLRSYVEERLLGPATSELEGLADRLEARVRGAGS
jgi:5-methylcytosine-specific restriction protein B